MARPFFLQNQRRKKMENPQTTNTITGFQTLFNSGDIALVSAIIYDNPDQVNENLRSVGLPVGSNETEIFNVLKQEGPNLTEAQFCEILNVPFIYGPYTQSLYPVLLTEANVYNPGTTQSDSIRWGVFKNGLKKAYQRYFSSRVQVSNVITPDPMQMPVMVQNQSQEDADRKLIRKMRVKTALTWGILALLLIVVVIRVFKK